MVDTMKNWNRIVFALNQSKRRGAEGQANSTIFGK